MTKLDPQLTPAVRQAHIAPCIARLQSLDPASLPRPFAMIVDDGRGVTYRNEAFRLFLADEYLEKPILPGVLPEAIHRLMPEVARVHPHSKDVRSAS